MAHPTSGLPLSCMSNAAARSEIRIQQIDGGITAPAGFKAAGVYAGIKPATHAWPLDVMLLTADQPVSAAAVFTTNKTIAAPVVVSRSNLEKSGGRARAIVCNSGCANACTGDAGMQVARSTVEFVARHVGCRPEEVLVASTGVIGVDLDLDKVTHGVTAAAAALSRDGHHDALLAIMTTDPFPKEAAVRVETGAGTFHVGGMAKGSGMIEPMMATMLGFLTCDAQVEPALLKKALNAAVRDTFNAITVDGECSTNDTVFALANGESGVVVDEAALSGFRGGSARGVERAGAWHRPRRRGRDQARHHSRHGRDGVGARRACRADHRELAAGQDGGARRRPELGTAGRCGRPLGRAVRARARRRSHRRDRACSRTGSRTTRNAEKAAGICRARTSTSRSISAPAETSRPQSGRAISAPST